MLETPPQSRIQTKVYIEGLTGSTVRLPIRSSVLVLDAFNGDVDGLFGLVADMMI